MFEEILELYNVRLAEAERDRVGYQAMIQLVATIKKISQEGRSSQSIAASLKKLEDEVNRQSKELRDLKNMIGAKKGISPPGSLPPLS